jgi:hypothetical protein
MDGWTIFSTQTFISGKLKSEKKKRFWKYRKNFTFFNYQVLSVNFTEVVTVVIVRLAL